MKIAFTIFGECVSMKNSRQQVMVGPKDNKRMLFIKSQDARNYETSVLKQIPPAARQMLTGPVRVTLRMFYANRRKDMDEALLLDCMQARHEKVKGRLEKVAEGRYKHGEPVRVLKVKGVYLNDNQVRERHVFWFFDPANPRVEVEVEPLEAQQADMLGDEVFTEDPAEVDVPF